jgi:hypothetical protein
MPPVAHIFGFALVVTAIGAWYDWRTGHIPNWLTLGALGAAIVAHGAYAFATSASNARAAFEAAGLSLVGAAICALVPALRNCLGLAGRLHHRPFVGYYHPLWCSHRLFRYDSVMT